MELSINQKYALSIEEAAEYFGVGSKRLREVIRRNPNSDWVLWAGSHAKIKRELFEKYLNSVNTI